MLTCTHWLSGVTSLCITPDGGTLVVAFSHTVKDEDGFEILDRGLSLFVRSFTKSEQEVWKQVEDEEGEPLRLSHQDTKKVLCLWCCAVGAVLCCWCYHVGAVLLVPVPLVLCCWCCPSGAVLLVLSLWCCAVGAILSLLNFSLLFAVYTYCTLHLLGLLRCR